MMKRLRQGSGFPDRTDGFGLSDQYLRVHPGRTSDGHCRKPRCDRGEGGNSDNGIFLDGDAFLPAAHAGLFPDEAKKAAFADAVRLFTGTVSFSDCSGLRFPDDCKNLRGQLALHLLVDCITSGSARGFKEAPFTDPECNCHGDVGCDGCRDVPRPSDRTSNRLEDDVYVRGVSGGFDSRVSDRSLSESFERCCIFSQKHAGASEKQAPDADLRHLCAVGNCLLHRLRLHRAVPAPGCELSGRDGHHRPDAVRWSGSCRQHALLPFL